jgi:hypothetical protein
MTETVERVAKALCDAQGYHREDFEALARIAIEAMREPTQAQLDAANFTLSDLI